MMVLPKAALRWVAHLPTTLSRAREDIDAVRRNDPAARSSAEVVLLYPGVHAPAAPPRRVRARRDRDRRGGAHRLGKRGSPTGAGRGYRGRRAGAVIVPAHHRFDAALDHANLPDPVMDVMRILIAQNDTLRLRVAHLEDKLGVEHAEEPPRFVSFDGEERPPADGG